jgi:5'-nucleotidase
MGLTGRQIYGVLNAQWADPSDVKMLQLSGLSYTWDNGRPPNDRVIEIRKNGVSINKNATYSVTVNSFLSTGGDNFSAFKNGTNNKNGPIDLDALVNYLSKLPQPFTKTIDDRIVRRN